MENVIVKGAVSATLLALGGLAGVAIASNAGGSNSEPAAALKPKVRTEVIHRTIHHTRTAQPAGSDAAPPAAGYTSRPVSTYVAPVATEPAAAVSSSSGSGGDHKADDQNEAEYSHDSDQHHENEGEGEDDD